MANFYSLIKFECDFYTANLPEIEPVILWAVQWNLMFVSTRCLIVGDGYKQPLV